MSNKFIIILVSLCITICTLLTVPIQAYATIDGFSEKVEALQIKKVVTDDELEKMLYDRKSAFDDYWSYWLKNTKEMGWTNGKSDDELYEEQWGFVTPDFDYGFLVSCLKTNKYLSQYSQIGKLGYLFGETQYWSVGSSIFLMDGSYVANPDEYFDDQMCKFAIDEEEKSFLSSIDQIENSLIDSKIHAVTEVKLFAPADLLSFMYIKGDGNEYLIKISDHVGEDGYIPNIEKYKVYPVATVIDEITTFASGKRLAKSSVLKKPTYETEAEELQSEGLLQGNDNGLDLLKPLTRAEAITLLVRALGEEETALASSDEEVFTDMYNTEWAVPYVSYAYETGLTTGTEDGLFNPEGKVTSDHFATFVLRAAGEGDVDYTQGTQILIDRGIITEEQSETMDLFTRGDMAKIIYEAMNKGLL